MIRTVTMLTVALLASLPGVVPSSQASGFTLDVLVDGAPRSQYEARGTVYVEAVRGESYALRLENPTSSRVAVALSVDGLNTIDARHTDARSASKWVIDPYDSIVISGWQVSGGAARKFYFTGERDSYGAALGQTENLGVISAVVFRERATRLYESRSRGALRDEERGARSAAPEGASAESRRKAQLSDDYAATGMGHRFSHRVERIELDLEPDSVASISVRYEFHRQLVELGVLPATPAPLERRERARGFEPYCPEPY